ncbi:MAG: hypothetical protein HY761_04985 [Candidatus Omnitrophica bacterium]|nr:hypothetical protein [Candidatus Omnitrophota bacterium]
MINKTKIITLLIALIFTVMFSDVKTSFGENIKIIVSNNQIPVKINPLIFGNNMIGYDPTMLEDWTTSYVGYSNYGSGVWNPQTMQSVPAVINFAKEIGIKILRFPGGNESWFYNWKKTIGNPSQRPHFLYGLDEFLKTCEELGAAAVFTLPYFTGTPQDAADLVEYLNSLDDGSNPAGGIDWARERANNGHPLPYNVKFYELSSEVNYGSPKKGVSPADPVKYAEAYLVYRKAMKAVDSTIQLGAVTVNSGSVGKGISAWNDSVFKTAGNTIDFLIEHTYRPWYTSNDETVDPDQLFDDTLKSLNEVDKYYKTLSRHFEMVTARRNIPIAVTEYNGGFEQNRPIPFRHSLGTALFNAGLLQLFMKPENNILFANYWQFINSFWGMIKNDQFMQGGGVYIKRPNYYALEMFHKHFGTELIDVTADSIGSPSDLNSINLLSGIKWQTEQTFGAEIKVSQDDVEVYFTGESDLNFYHVHKKVAVKPHTTYHLSAYIKAENLQDKEGVLLEIQDGRGWSKTRSNAVTERAWGTIDWISVGADYTTLSDASDISVIVRRVKRSSGPVKGKVFVRKVSLVEKPVNLQTENNALSASASLNKDGNKLYLMVLNKNVYQDLEASIMLRDFSLSNSVNVWTLGGGSVATTNETDPNNVKITHKLTDLQNENTLSYLFPAHSLTALEFTLKENSLRPSPPVLHQLPSRE